MNELIWVGNTLLPRWEAVAMVAAGFLLCVVGGIVARTGIYLLIGHADELWYFGRDCGTQSGPHVRVSREENSSHGQSADAKK